jgi:tetratricopeptide (TPR) repeat protein
VGWLWYVGTLVPLIGLVQAGLHAMTDRHSYIPLVGLDIALPWLVADVAAAWRARPFTLGAAGTAVVLALAALSWRQTHLWRDSITLFEHTINVTDENDVARYNLALVLEREGRRAEAIRLYEEAVAINPEYVSARLNLGAALAQEARFDEAVEQLEALLRQKPDDEMAHHNLANVLVELGRDDVAADHYRRAIALRPDWPQPLIGLTWVLASSPSERLRDGREAVRLGERARDLIRRGGPAEIGQLAGCLDALAAAYAEAGRYPEAIRTAEEAADVAIATNNAGLAREIQRARLRRYRERQPFRQPVKGTGTSAPPQ